MAVIFEYFLWGVRSQVDIDEQIFLVYLKHRFGIIWEVVVDWVYRAIVILVLDLLQFLEPAQILVYEQ